MEHRGSNYELYDLELMSRGSLRDPVILQAIPKSRALRPKLPMDAGDDTFNLSAVLGNKNGDFDWGSGGFEQSTEELWIETRDFIRYLYVKLQNKSGELELKRINLDEKFELQEYVHRLNKEPYYKLVMSKTPTPQVSCFHLVRDLSLSNIPKRTLVLCFDGTSNHFSNQVGWFHKLLSHPYVLSPEYQRGQIYGPPEENRS